VVVHGGGDAVSELQRARGMTPSFVGGRRVTTRDALEVVRESFASVNAELCAAIGDEAVPLFGDEIGLKATQVAALGLVGDPIPCAPTAVLAALADGRIPVVAPLAEGPLNVNADEAAAALAVGLGADSIVFVTDVPGVLDRGVVVPVVDAEEASRLLDSGELSDGIVPKLRAALTAARLGVRAQIGETAVVA
jgi:acetylglutamate kinase